MWRNYLASALGNLARNKLYAAINIIGLALGAAAALLIALYVRDELTFDRSVPGYRDVYLVTSRQHELNVGEPPYWRDAALYGVGPRLKLQFPEISSVARLMPTRHPPQLRHGNVQAYETGFAWVDPDFFDVLPMKALAGDLNTALKTPDGLVLTRSAARRYFGRDDPVGEILEVDPALEGASLPAAFRTPHPMRVNAVIADLPSNSNLQGEVFASGLAPFSLFALWDLTAENGPLRLPAYTWVRLKPGASGAALDRALAAFSARELPPSTHQSVEIALHLTPITALHFAPAPEDALVPRGDPRLLWSLAAIGVLIIVSASINFVTLMTARAGRRALETGVRKAMGAGRGDLVAQFLCETLMHVAVAMGLAVVLVELLLPHLNAALKRTIGFDYLGDPALALAIVGATVALGLLAGAYPAFVLSAFRPAKVLKRQLVQSPAGDLARKVLVTVQFAIMIGLVVGAVTLWRQTLFSLNDRLRVDGSKILTIEDACDHGVAADSAARAFREQVAAIPGVEASVCTSTEALYNDGEPTPVRLGGRSPVSLDRAQVDFGALEFFGVEPVAGRFFVRDRGVDGGLGQGGPARSAAVVLNETAARGLGFTPPAAAVGRSLTWPHLDYTSSPPRADYTSASEIIGVAPDFTLDTRAPVKPLMFVVQPNALNVFGVRVTGRDLPETLAAIDRAWTATGHRLIHRRFLDQTLQAHYAAIILQGSAVGLGAGLAIVVAVLGLFGLSAHAAEQRVKEIGVRKAMGASAGDIVRLLLSQFSQPVLWANLVAWPVAWWIMNRWLSGFAYHVDLPIWLFLAAGGAALVIACATVLTHALLVARAAPATALRYE